MEIVDNILTFRSGLVWFDDVHEEGEDESEDESEHESGHESERGKTKSTHLSVNVNVNMIYPVRLNTPSPINWGSQQQCSQRRGAEKIDKSARSQLYYDLLFVQSGLGASESRILLTRWQRNKLRLAHAFIAGLSRCSASLTSLRMRKYAALRRHDMRNGTCTSMYNLLCIRLEM